MARLHADTTIRPNYVREVCRILKASNILLLKNDLEFVDNQEDINKDQEERRANEDNDLFVSTSHKFFSYSNYFQFREWKRRNVNWRTKISIAKLRRR